MGSARRLSERNTEGTEGIRGDREEFGSEGEESAGMASDAAVDWVPPSPSSFKTSSLFPLISSVPSVFLSMIGLSNVSATLAMPLGLRAAEPAKMTSIISWPRRLLLERSPRTHLMASTTLDLPQPLGPTMPVMTWSKENSVLSAKLLKPQSVSFERRKRNLRGANKRRRPAANGVPGAARPEGRAPRGP